MNFRIVTKSALAVGLLSALSGVAQAEISFHELILSNNSRFELVITDEKMILAPDSGFSREQNVHEGSLFFPRSGGDRQCQWYGNQLSYTVCASVGVAGSNRLIIDLTLWRQEPETDPSRLEYEENKFYVSWGAGCRLEMLSVQRVWRAPDTSKPVCVDLSP